MIFTKTQHPLNGLFIALLLCLGLQSSALGISLPSLMQSYSASVDSLPPSPEALAQQQLDAYNARDIDAFLIPYSEEVEIYNFPGGEPSMKGKENMRQSYKSMFENIPDLHCKLVNRMVMGNTVIDQELVSGLPGGRKMEAIAIYKIEDGKIAKVYFIQ